MHSLSCYKTKAVFLAIASVFISTWALAIGIPKWVTNTPEDREYLYVVGIKTGALALEEGKRSAINQAVTELTEHFEVRSKTRYYEKKTEIETRLLDEIDSRSSDTKLKGVLLKDWYFEKSEKGFDVYVLVQYPKAELEKERQRAQNILAEKTSSVRRLLNGGMDAWGRGDATAAFLALANALKEANDMDDEGFHQEALGRLRDLLQSIEIEAISVESQKAEIFKKLKEPLVARVFIKRGGFEIPLKGVPIQFNASWDEGKGDIVYTDEKGLASYQGLKVKTQSGPIVVTASPELIFLPSVTIQKLERVTVDAYIDALAQKKIVFTIEPFTIKKNIRISVSISGNNSVNESLVEAAISAGLADAGYDLAGLGDNDTADLAVSCSIRSRKGSANMGWGYSIHIDGAAKAVNLRTGRVMAQKSLTGIVGFGDTEEKAMINSLKIFSAEMTEGLLEKILE